MTSPVRLAFLAVALTLATPASADSVTLTTRFGSGSHWTVITG